MSASISSGENALVRRCIRVRSRSSRRFHSAVCGTHPAFFSKCLRNSWRASGTAADGTLFTEFLAELNDVAGGGANSPRDKVPVLLALREELEELKVLLRLCHDIKAFPNFNSFEHAISQK